MLINEARFRILTSIQENRQALTMYLLRIMLLKNQNGKYLDCEMAFRLGAEFSVILYFSPGSIHTAIHNPLFPQMEWMLKPEDFEKVIHGFPFAYERVRRRGGYSYLTEKIKIIKSSCGSILLKSDTEFPNYCIIGEQVKERIDRFHDFFKFALEMEMEMEISDE